MQMAEGGSCRVARVWRCERAHSNERAKSGADATLMFGVLCVEEGRARRAKGAWRSGGEPRRRAEARGARAQIADRRVGERSAGARVQPEGVAAESVWARAE